MNVKKGIENTLFNAEMLWIKQNLKEISKIYSFSLRIVDSTLDGKLLVFTGFSTSSTVFLCRMTSPNFESFIWLSVDGGWSIWSTWSTCGGLISCTSGSLFKRTRTCTDPAPFKNGLACSGIDTQESALGELKFC